MQKSVCLSPVALSVIYPRLRLDSFPVCVLDFDHLAHCIGKTDNLAVCVPPREDQVKLRRLLLDHLQYLVEFYKLEMKGRERREHEGLRRRESLHRL